MQVPRLQEDPRLITKDEKKFRKEIYRHNPSLKRASLYYIDQTARDALNKMEKERDEDGKRCAICLDEFESGQEVMLTPCNHMFHKDCIMPRVKSNSDHIFFFFSTFLLSFLDLHFSAIFFSSFLFNNCRC